ncbi:MAG: Fe-S cluster assembly protein SufD [Dysgonamonadaceae bacterium]|jgi:Fe-S cluster assembly protein SufD|nr:Fe-S cluster assembly protein SufD [Dysgonamonadaceae bacterium]
MKQYTDFFKSHRQIINQSSHSLLNHHREKAFDSFSEKGFPVCGSEDYQHTDIPKWLEPDFGFYIGHRGTSGNPGKLYPCNVPGLSSYSYFVINGYFYPHEVKKELPQGVFSGSLNSFAENHPELFSKYYNRLAEQKGAGLSAFNTMFVQDGYVLYIPKNIVINDPIQLTDIADTNRDSLINRRILIILESGAEAKLLVCDHAAENESVSASTQVAELFIGENASFDFYELEESSKKNIRLTSNFVRQASSSRVVINNITLDNGITRNNYEIDLDGENAETHLYGLAIVDEKQRVDNFTLINHNTAHCRSNELFKYILDHEAVGAFGGKITVAQGARKTQAYQNNRNLSGSKNCRMFSKPQLIIHADDVKCSHGMTTGQLDETALFYLQSRGIPKSEAVFLLKYAFTNDVIQGVRIDSLKERLKMLIEKRFKGELIRCRGCF